MKRCSSRPGRPLTRLRPHSAEYAAACQLDFADSFSPATTVMPAASSSFCPVSGPKACAVTETILMSRHLQVAATVKRAEPGHQHTAAFVVGQFRRCEHVADELATNR
jgi:hypothetical protein